MALRDKKEAESPRVIEISAKMQGTLSFKDPVNMKINGQFEGTLETRGTLTVGDTASVDAHITGETIIIAGKVKGDVVARKMLMLMPTATLHGNISTPRLSIAEGATFQGQCQMADEDLNIDELSRYLELDSKSIIELATSGKIPATQDGNTWKFKRSRIEAWIASEKIK